MNVVCVGTRLHRLFPPLKTLVSGSTSGTESKCHIEWMYCRWNIPACNYQPWLQQQLFESQLITDQQSISNLQKTSAVLFNFGWQRQREIHNQFPTKKHREGEENIQPNVNATSDSKHGTDVVTLQLKRPQCLTPHDINYFSTNIYRSFSQETLFQQHTRIVHEGDWSHSIFAATHLTSHHRSLMWENMKSFETHFWNLKLGRVKRYRKSFHTENRKFVQKNALIEQKSTWLFMAANCLFDRQSQAQFLH